MNIVDYVIIGVVAISVLFGLYRGFVASVLNMGGGLISFLGSFALYPKLAAMIQNNQELQRTLLHYTDASSRIGDLELALFATQVNVVIQEDGGSVHLEYQLDMQGSYAAVQTIDVTWTVEGAC